MDESAWLAGNDPMPMLAALRAEANARKLRLFACAVCRRLVWHLLVDGTSREAVAVAELFADGQVSAEELGTARQSVTNAMAAEAYGTKGYQAATAAQAACRTDWSAEVLAHHAAYAASASSERKVIGVERRSKAVRARQKAASAATKVAKATEADLLRDIFGPLPFRPRPPLPASVPAWNSGTVIRLATAAYEERLLPQGTLDPGRLAVLADALEEAGLDNRELLQHLREPGAVHVRGCWAVDLLLAKG